MECVALGHTEIKGKGFVSTPLLVTTKWAESGGNSSRTFGNLLWIIFEISFWIPLKLVKSCQKTTHRYHKWLVGD